MAGSVRIDKWLWAARFFRTRSAAAKEIDLGRVSVGGVRVKASRGVRPGELVSIRKGVHEIEVEVLELSDKRGPAARAQQLYRETEASTARREQVAEQMRIQRAEAPDFGGRGRPTKKDRRDLIKVKRLSKLR